MRMFALRTTSSRADELVVNVVSLRGLTDHAWLCLTPMPLSAVDHGA
jgi:hypothetical protein